MAYVTLKDTLHADKTRKTIYKQQLNKLKKNFTTNRRYALSNEI